MENCFAEILRFCGAWHSLASCIYTRGCWVVMLQAISFHAFSISPFKNFEIPHLCGFRWREAQEKKIITKKENSSICWAPLVELKCSNFSSPAPTEWHHSPWGRCSKPSKPWKASPQVREAASCPLQAAGEAQSQQHLCGVGQVTFEHVCAV